MLIATGSAIIFGAGGFGHTDAVAAGVTAAAFEAAAAFSFGAPMDGAGALLELGAAPMDGAGALPELGAAPMLAVWLAVDASALDVPFLEVTLLAEPAGSACSDGALLDDGALLEVANVGGPTLLLWLADVSAAVDAPDEVGAAVAGAAISSTIAKAALMAPHT